MSRQRAIVENVYLDSRLEHDEHSYTFVKSLITVPIRTIAPLGAISVYWAQSHRATSDESRPDRGATFRFALPPY